MKRLMVTLLWISCGFCAQGQKTAADEQAADIGSGTRRPDLLRFTNSDTLHGSFNGFSDGRSIQWKSPEAAQPILFTTDKIHRIVLRGGLAKLRTHAESTISLINGDIVHGNVTAANADTIHVECPYLGIIELSRDKVSSLSLKPHGGKLHYYGPLNTAGWKTIATIAAQNPDLDAQKSEQPTSKDIADPAYKGWQCLSNAWWSGQQQHHCLVMENALPDKCILSFELAWQDSLYAQIGLFADLSPPACQTTKNLKSYMATAIGNAHTIYINNHSVSLYTYSFDENGEPEKNRVEDSASVNLRNAETAHVEFRVDRHKKQLLFYLDGEFKMKWPLADLPDKKGNALAFFKPAYTHTPSRIRISDITIAHWNGLEDSARSARNSDHDIVLLSNGLDRFSGKFVSLSDDLVRFEGQYGNQLKIPKEQITEINFASKNLLTKPEAEKKSLVHFYTLPHGRISGTPVASNGSHGIISSEIMGTIHLNTDYVSIIDFSQQNNLLDFWNDHF